MLGLGYWAKVLLLAVALCAITSLLLDIEGPLAVLLGGAIGIVAMFVVAIYEDRKRRY